MSISWGLQSGQFCFSYSQDLSTTSMGHSGLSSLLCCFQPNLWSAKFGTAPRASLDLYQAHPSLSWQHVSHYTVLKSLPLGFPWPLTELPHQAWIQAVALTLLGWNWDFLSPQNHCPSRGGISSIQGLLHEGRSPDGDIFVQVPEETLKMQFWLFFS